MKRLQYKVCKSASNFGYGKCPAHFPHLNAEKASVVCCVTFTRQEMLVGAKHWHPRIRPSRLKVHRPEKRPGGCASSLPGGLLWGKDRPTWQAIIYFFLSMSPSESLLVLVSSFVCCNSEALLALSLFSLR